MAIPDFLHRKGRKGRKDLLKIYAPSDLLIFLCQFFRDETWRRFMIHEWRESAIPDFLCIQKKWLPLLHVPAVAFDVPSTLWSMDQLLDAVLDGVML